MIDKRPKKIFLRYGQTSLEVRCLRDGTLDVDIETGEVFSIWGGKRKKRKLKVDADGYLGFLLQRERKDRRGKPMLERNKKGKVYKRYRERRYVLVNRLVKIKALAVAKGGHNWEPFVCDLPPGIDVNHIGDRQDNNHLMLELATERANRGKTEMTDEEYAHLQAVF